MPLYEYLCPEGEKHEVLVLIGKAGNPQFCPQHGRVMERLIGTPAVIIKGSRFVNATYADPEWRKKAMRKDFPQPTDKLEDVF